MIKNIFFCAVAALTVGFTGFTFAGEVPNPAKDPIGQRVAPDGSEIRKDQSGPLALPFGGADKETAKPAPITPRKNTIGVTGEIESLTNQRVRVKDGHGKIRVFNLTEKTVTTDPQGSSGIILKKGDTVSVLFDEKTLNLQNVQIIK